MFYPQSLLDFLRPSESHLTELLTAASGGSPGAGPVVGHGRDGINRVHWRRPRHSLMVDSTVDICYGPLMNAKLKKYLNRPLINWRPVNKPNSFMLNQVFDWETEAGEPYEVHLPPTC